MRILVAGATGVIGVPLVRLLVADGHTVAGLTRSKPEVVESLGAEPIVVDVYEADALREAVERFGPDVVIDELTDLPDDLAELERSRPAQLRMRTDGTRNLLRAAGAARFLSESVTFPGSGVEEHERIVLDAGGVVLRYGRLYGPGTFYEDEPPEPPRVRVDEAAQRTVAALDTPSGIVEIVEG